MLFNPLLVLLTTPAQIHSIPKLAGPIGTTSLASRRSEWTPSLPPTFLTKIYLILSSRVLLEGSDYQKVLEGWASFLSSPSCQVAIEGLFYLPWSVGTVFADSVQPGVAEFDLALTTTQPLHS
ncbi:hypothetical protein C8J57DRAFT_1251264 [Mycena rebaudengoi]|nr:hypothetical protein C8J57DRAFT_1251264 [Mycena rebaudengoi]